MGHRQVSHCAETSNHRLDELTLAIDKKILSQKIIDTYAQLKKIESIAGPSKQSQKLRERITSLQNQLDYIRSLARYKS
jgi:cell division protein FtsB